MLTRTHTDTVTTIRLAHGKVNALDIALCEALARELADLASGPEEAVVITGTGSSFCAGVDLVQVAAGGADYLRRFLPVMDTLFRAVLTFPKPLVAAVNGHAIAGGCVLATACDRVVMADGPGRMGITELTVGVPFPLVPLEIVRARVPERDFRELLYGAQTVAVSDALRLGMVDAVVPAEALGSRAIEAARHLAAVPTATFQLTKRAVVAPILARAHASADIEADVDQVWASDEIQASIRAFLTKRAKPRAGNG